MNYYLDTEFIEDFQPVRSFLTSWFKPTRQIHYVDLISIGIVAEDGRDYYSVSNEFNLKHVWNKYDLSLPERIGDPPVKVYWLRENVLKPIWLHLRKQITGAQKNYTSSWETFTYNHLKQLILRFGKTKNRIAEEIQAFTARVSDVTLRVPQFTMPVNTQHEIWQHIRGINKTNPPSFYGYFCDYDWVVFCSLFGRMLNLPEGYPMYCRDLKQIMDDLKLTREWKDQFVPGDNEHHALADALWNKKLHRALKAEVEINLHPALTRGIS